MSMDAVRAFTVALALASAAGARAQAPYLVKDIVPGPGGSYPTGPVRIGDRVYFGAWSPEWAGELWSTAGTETSTTVLELPPGVRAGRPIPVGAAGNDLLFVFFEGPSGLWSTDGTLAGTRRIADEFPVSLLAQSSDRALFESDTDRQPLLSDGSEGGTFLVPPPLGGTPGEPWIGKPATAFAGGFAIAMANYEGAWWTNGTPAETTRLVDALHECRSTAAAGGRLFLLCQFPGQFPRLLVSDGTNSGTLPIVQGVALGFSLVAAGDQVFFMGPGGLWRSEGTSGSTGAVPMPAPVPTVPSFEGAASSGNILYFAGSTPETGTELWRTDGTAAGTFMLRDIEPGPGSGVDAFGSLGRMEGTPGGGLIFEARTTAAGHELWKSDGTAAGTVPLPEIFPGPESSYPVALTSAGGRVYFLASSPTHGAELWAVDVAKGAVTLDDTFLQEGDSGAATATFTVRLESAASVPVLVSYQTVAVTAQAGTDFAAQSGTLTFAPGERERTVEVPVFGDVADERNESLKLVLTPIGGAALADGTGTLVILDDDAPRVRAAGATLVEGNSGFTEALFDVTIETDGDPTETPVSVHFAPVAGTATAGSDFGPFPGTVTFPAGSPSGTSLTARVPVLGDVVDEPNETFTLALDGQNEVDVTGAFPVGTIIDDDGVAAARPVELSHGASLRADLAPLAGPGPDRDFYVLLQQPDASYEVAVDETSGDAAPLTVQRIGADGTTVLQTAAPVGTGTGLSLRWFNTVVDPFANQHVRVESASCGTSCGPDDAYRVRFYETTLRASRVNNQNGQVTVLLLQNLSDAEVIGRIHFRDEPGTSGGAQPFSVPARGTLVFDTTQITPIAGSLKVVHDAPYGALVGKVVALEPATGFSFDTPLTARPR
jgi:ELWxxDGT repeat protein